MKSKNIEIRRITFSKFEFNIHNTGEVEEDGRASIKLIKMEISYPDSQYRVVADIDAIYSVLASDLPEDISQDSEFQQALITPMIEKFRLYIGMFSEGAYGAILIPNLNFNQD